MLILLLGLIFLYGWVMLRRMWAWQQMPPAILPPDFRPKTKISVIIPIRNESQNITRLLQDLSNQTYPAHLFEVLVVNDHSEDNSEELVNQLAGQVPFTLQCLNLAEQTGKKAAVALGVAAAIGELLVFTDGDCRVQPNWLTYFAFYYVTKEAKFISGPVCYEPTPTFFEKMQLVEFASLIGTGGSSIALGKPNMCNGANLAYPKEIFTQVNGFAGNAHLPSGDDEFLMHKVHQQYPGSVYFLKASAATVFTQAKPTLASFFAQRLRWASKWPAYQQIGVKLLAILVFGVNFMLFLGLLLALTNNFSWFALSLAFGLKFLIDFLFLKPVLKFFNKLKYSYIILPLQFIYVPYVVITALAGLRGSYHWKGRKIKP
ncbi:MAG: glycosyltransferase [Adhaeribacter sp.]